MRLLFVEDSKRLQQSVGTGLRRLGYALDSAEDGEEGLWLAESNSYDVIILDLMLPKLDGFSLLRQLRAKGCKTHILILTARDAVPDRVAGLNAGADDYLPKPFEFDELVARIQALARRAHGQKSSTIEVGTLLIDMGARSASRAGELLPLTAREYSLLEYLSLRKGQVVSRTDIEAHIYDDRVEPMSNVVDVAICNLRKKIDEPEGPSLIQTRRGMGYILVVPGEAGDAQA